MRSTLVSIVVATVWLFSASPSFAQNFGQITGIVADTTGGVLVGATVTVTNTQTGATAVQQVNNAGVYVFPNLLPGIYNVKIEMDGFRGAARNRVELQIQQTIRLDFRLEIGALTEVVEAVASAMITEDLTIGTVIENRRIVELPLNGRNFLKMVELTPNVSASFSGSGSSVRDRADRSGEQLSIGGGRREWNYFTLDGINNTDVNFNCTSSCRDRCPPGIQGTDRCLFGRARPRARQVSDDEGRHQCTTAPYSSSSAITNSTRFRLRRNGSDIKSVQVEPVRVHLGGPQLGPVFNGRDKLFFMANYEGFRLGIRETVSRAVRRDAKRRLLADQHRAQRPGDEHAVSREPHPERPHEPHLAGAAGLLPGAKPADDESGQQLPRCESEQNGQEPDHDARRFRGERSIDVVRPLQLDERIHFHRRSRAERIDGHDERSPGRVR
jgi:hypothetical protein